MPIVSASNGIRPEIRALAVIKLNKPVTPKEINDYVGTGDYAAKYISFLNTRYGFTIEAQKDGRTVVAYVCIAEPANVAALRATKPKETKVDKLAKQVKLKASNTPSSRLRVSFSPRRLLRLNRLQRLRRSRLRTLRPCRRSLLRLRRSSRSLSVSILSRKSLALPAKSPLLSPSMVIGIPCRAWM